MTRDDLKSLSSRAADGFSLEPHVRMVYTAFVVGYMPGDGTADSEDTALAWMRLWADRFEHGEAYKSAKPHQRRQIGICVRTILAPENF